MGGKSLVIGASGFLGSHVTTRLVRQGADVRVLFRSNSNTERTDPLAIERVVGDLRDRESLRQAMRGCATVYHCAVDTRAWLRDPSPLYRVNVDGLVQSMEAALEAAVSRFVLTSTICTIGHNPSGVASEADSFNWRGKIPAYVAARVAAENTFFEYCRSGLPGVACCVANTYGAGDVQPTPHGKLLIAVAKGQMPFYLDVSWSCVGIEDAAEALILAGARGATGERYIVSEKSLSQRNLHVLAAQAAGVRPKLMRMPLRVAYALGWVADSVARLRGVDSQLSVDSVRLSHIMDHMDSSKAARELGWRPRPVEHSIREAIEFYAARGWT